MKVLVKFNKNISTPKQIKTFKVFNIGEVISNINDLLNDSIIEIDNETLPIIKLKENDIYKYYLINDLGRTPNLIYPYYTDDFTKDITIDDLILIKSNSGDANVQSDWNQTDNTEADYIKNKPFIPQNLSDLNNDLNLFSGDYNDLSNLPTLFSGNYNDLSGIPSSFNPSSHGHLISDVSGLSTALNQKIDDAPSDGLTYGRKDGAWIPFTVSAKRKQYLYFSFAGTNLNNASNYWWGTDFYMGHFNESYSVNASFTPSNNFSSFNQFYGVNRPAFFDSYVKNIYMSFANVGETYTFDIAFLNYKLSNGYNSGVGNGVTDRVIIGREANSVAGATGLKKFMDLSNINTTQLIEKGSCFRMFLNSGGSTNAGFGNPLFIVELEEA